MPHLLLEYSNNILEKTDVSGVLKQCNELAANLLPSDIANCKSRAVEHAVYCIGNQQENGAFIHLDVRALSGRSPEILQQLAQQLCECLKDAFVASAQTYDLQISVNVGQLDNAYVKYRSGSA